MESGLEILKPFDDISPPYTQTQDNIVFAQGDQNLSNINTLSIGAGSQVFRTDKQGIWLGSDKFPTAPFSVSMNGVITSKSTVSGNIQTIDGLNGRMVWNDGTTNRIVIGNV